MTTLSLRAKQDFLERDAATRDPIRAIAEFVWNALDADSTNIQVTLERNDLGGLEAIRVIDNGSEVVRENEARLQFVQKKLQVEVSDEEIEQRIADLRQLVVK